MQQPDERAEMALNEPDHELTLWGIVRRGWFLFTFQGGKQLLAAFVGALPLTLLFGLVMSLPLLVGDEYVFASMIALAVLFTVYMVYLPLVLGAVVCLTSAAHCGEQISMLRAYRRTWSHYGHLLLAFFGVYLGTVMGMLCFVVPGVWFACKYGMAWVIVPIEKSSVREAFARSNLLLQGRKRVFLLVQLVFVALNMFLISGIVAVVIFTQPLVGGSFVASFLLISVCLQVSIMVIVPYIPMMTAFYYDAIKRSRFDLNTQI